MKALVIIPAYNEAGNIIKTVEDIKTNAPSFDYVIINDCSKDDTMRLCERMKYNVVNMPLNSGIGAAVQCGYLYAKRYGYEYAVQVDGDGQHDATFLEEMLSIMEKEKMSMLIGSRFIENQGFQSSFFRRIGIRWFSCLILCFTGKVITDPTSGMRMVGRNVINFFAEEYPKDYPEPETAITLLELGYTIKEIPVRMKERKEGTSSISLKRSIYYMFKVTLACIMAGVGYSKYKKNDYEDKYYGGMDV
ncbi:MAG: glycosyltransferase family 2 protein [Lachnospiraceae bacterium]|nr:glycosyltransferase family 2 protein [Lachnospiraceae bacterium]